MYVHLIVIFFVFGSASNFEINKLYESEGDLKIAFVIEDCTVLKYDAPLTRSLVNSAIWTIERINLLEITAPLTIGLDVFKVCTEMDFYSAIFAMFHQQEDRGYLLGMITKQPMTPKMKDFCRVLDIQTATVVRIWTHLIKATVNLLAVLNWKDDVIVVAENSQILIEFYKKTREESICVKNVFEIEKSTEAFDKINSAIVIFGTNNGINSILSNIKQKSNRDQLKLIFVPLDGSTIEGLPEGSYIIQPVHADLFTKYTKSPKIIPSPLLFDMASPILDFTRNVSALIVENCSETIYKTNCFRNNYKKTYGSHVHSYNYSLNLLKIEHLASKFNYDVYHIENITLLNMNNLTRQFDQARSNVFQSLTKVFTYNVFNEKLIDFDEPYIVDNDTSTDCAKIIKCAKKCLNFQSPQKQYVSNIFHVILRSESWIFAFASVSILGVIFCIAILIFVIIRMRRKQIFEGNPTLTILLLFLVMFMYLCIIPFCLDGDLTSKRIIYLMRSIGVTIPYAGVFSLLLSRVILLATVSKEVGFMSHVAGTVQSFLCLFIFGVQCALSIQILRYCQDGFHESLIVYMLTYNIILLMLLLCLCPLISKSQRNYREGRYFTIAIVLIACSWSCWLPCYAILSEEWKDPMLCLGLVSTSSILLGAVFIPRTYLMTVAAARDRFTSALPSLATAASTMDIYRASTQPLYDCVNVATVNALNYKNEVTQTLSHADLYASADAVAEDEIEIQSCGTPPNPDKVTRF